MATTPIYNWPTPDNTDLVKNGALSIRTLGNAIDTTTATLVPKSLVDAKGDLVTATANDTPARLAVGANGETLVANSSTATGLSYAGNFAAGKNKIINGAFDNWQRGTTFTAPSIFSYTSDRWQTIVNGTVSGLVVSQQTFTPGSAPVAGYEGTFFIRQIVTAQSGGSVQAIGTRLEDVRLFAGQTVTLSFYGRADASRTFTTRLIQNFGSGGSSEVSTSGSSLSVTTSFTRFTQTFTVPSIAAKTIGASSYLYVIIDGAINTAQTMDIWGVQLEAGSVATAFQTATGSIQGELAACQRYFLRYNSTSSSNGGSGQFYSSTACRIVIPLPVTMRVGPAISAQNTTVLLIGGGNVTPTGWGSSLLSSKDNVSFDFTGCSAGASVFQQCIFNGFTDISAEL